MSEINFLPERFVRKRRSRRRMVFEFLIVATTVAGLGYGYQVLNRKVQDMEEQASQLETRGTVARAKAEEASRLRKEFNEYAGSLRVQREVGLPIDHSNVLASIAKLQPDAVGLTELILECDRPKPAPPGVENTSKKPKKSKKAVNPPVSELKIQMVGIAPDDDRITDFFGKLDGNRLFRNVKLEFSRQVKVDNLVAMRFRITCTVPLDRLYRDKEKVEEVANAN